MSHDVYTLPPDLPEPMKLAAHLSHYALYMLMIGMPLIGWAMLSAAAYPVVRCRPPGQGHTDGGGAFKTAIWTEWMSLP